jgi:RNA 2',3'-cyclic 3'-phosphodiesterase
MRLFLAINLPESLRCGTWNATAAMREAGQSITWVAEPRLHITLKFIGEQEESVVAPLAEAMRAIGAGHLAPLITVGCVGAFPTFRRPRVVWIGIEPEPRFELLHHDVEVACEQLGFPLDGRPFRPHVTLGRVRDAIDAGQLRAVRLAAKKVPFTDEFHAATIDLMHSTVGPNGPTYATLATAPMRGT